MNAIAKKHRKRDCKDIQWYIEGTISLGSLISLNKLTLGARLFFESVWEHLRYVGPRFGRFKHLVALPLVGTGKGGASEYVFLSSSLDSLSTGQ